MSENKCCGNCKHFKDEDADGYGWSEKLKQATHCSFKCFHHEFKNNGWTEITPDNVDELYLMQERVVVSRCYFGGHHRTDMAAYFTETLSTMSKMGGFYYYVLPELKKEKRE